MELGGQKGGLSQYHYRSIKEASSITGPNRKRCTLHLLEQWSPNLLVPGTGFMEDNFPIDEVRVGWGGSGSNTNNGEQQWKLSSLAVCPVSNRPWRDTSL